MTDHHHCGAAVARAMSVRPATARSSTVACGSTPGASSTEPLRATTDSLLAPVHGSLAPSAWLAGRSMRPFLQLAA
jgi:hypothetical protein